MRRDQVAAFLGSLPLTLASNVFVSGSFAFMMWGSLRPGVLAGWVGLNAAIGLGRLGHARALVRRGLTERDPGLVLARMWVGALLSGLCWAWMLGACAAVGQAYTVSAGLAFCGINAGAVIQGSTNRAATLAFILPNSILFVLIFLGVGTLQSQVMAVNMLLLTVLMVRASGRAERAYLTAARLKHEARHLAASLARANVAAEQAMRRLDHAASHDPLTDLANRAAYERAFAGLLARAERGEGELSVVLIDLDRFKAVNDTCGHAAGDAVLVEAGRRLRAALGPGDVAARLGGDEFAALIFRKTLGEADAAIAEAIVRGLAAPFGVAGRTLLAGASVGLARAPRDARGSEDLQACADLALYAAKAAGRGTWRRFSEALRQGPSRQETRDGARGEVRDGIVPDRGQALVRDLAAALEAGTEVEVWFQPQVEAATGRPCGVEALLRWTHPALGPVPPPEVVAAAAAAGLSGALLGHVLRQGCRMAATLEAGGHGDVVVSVNVSPEAFGTVAVAAAVAAALAEHGLDGRRLAVEITEEAAYAAERGGADVAALRAQGVRVVIDDFGMAYASISALRAIPFDGLKIDRTFIGGLCASAGDGQDLALTGAILAFARALGAEVVAEGVETEAQAEVLRGLGCPVLQGYRYAPALPPARACTWIAQAAIAARIATPAAEEPRRAAAGTGRALAG